MKLSIVCPVTLLIACISSLSFTVPCHGWTMRSSLPISVISRHPSVVYRSQPATAHQRSKACTLTGLRMMTGDHRQYISRKFVSFVAKGVIIPFPALRRVLLVMYPPTSSNNSNKNMSIGLSFWEGVLALFLYLAMGVASYHFLLEPTWTIVDSLYFTVTCFTSVGYGDICPSSRASKLFTCFFGLGGIAFLGTAIAAVGSSFLEAETLAIQKARIQSKRRIMTIFENMNKIVPVFKHNPKENQQKIIQKARDKRKMRLRLLTKSFNIFGHIKTAIYRIIPTVVVVIGGGAIVNYLNYPGKISVLDCIYYSLITASTIGLGDISPQTQKAKLFAIFYIPLAVVAAGEVLSSIAIELIQRRQRQVYKSQLENDLTIENLLKMDSDGDGKITPEEYIQFMLIEMGRVDKKEIDELHEQFRRLDVTKSGYLDNEDLLLIAKIRGADVIE